MLFSEPKIPQRAFGRADGWPGQPVSVLFSEPKIPQPRCSSGTHGFERVSVLFSEPKIPQLYTVHPLPGRRERFQCSSASRKFLNKKLSYNSGTVVMFQCSSASRKFLNSRTGVLLPCGLTVSVLFSEPKIPQLVTPATPATCACRRFSALQRAENSSTPTLAPASIHISDRDDHASSFLSLPGASP